MSIQNNKYCNWPLLNFSNARSGVRLRQTTVRIVGPRTYYFVIRRSGTFQCESANSDYLGHREVNRSFTAIAKSQPDKLQCCSLPHRRHSFTHIKAFVHFYDDPYPTSECVLTLDFTCCSSHRRPFINRNRRWRMPERIRRLSVAFTFMQNQLRSVEHF